MTPAPAPPPAPAPEAATPLTVEAVAADFEKVAALAARLPADATDSQRDYARGRQRPRRRGAMMPRYTIPRCAHCESGGLPVVTAALTVAVVALATGAAAITLGVLNQRRLRAASAPVWPHVTFTGAMPPGYTAQATIRPLPPPKSSQPPQPEEPCSSPNRS